MKVLQSIALVLLLASGCASQSPKAVVPGPTANAAGPNWNEVDKTAARVKERELKKQEDLKSSETVTVAPDGTVTYEKTVEW